MGVLANRAMTNPATYGLPRDGSLVVGDKVDINKLIGDRAELDKLIEKAMRLTEAQMLSISKNHQLIKEWLTAHPNETLDESKVGEILSAKKAPKILKALESPKPINNKSITELENQVVEARSQPANNHYNNETTETRSGTLPESRSMMGDFLDHQKLEAAFKDDINSIYGKNKLFGLSKVAGVKSAEWNGIKSMPAKKFTEFFTHNSEEGDLPSKLREILASAPQHRNMALHLSELMKLSGGKVKPFENENLEAFIRRLGGYVMSNLVL